MADRRTHQDPRRVHAFHAIERDGAILVEVLSGDRDDVITLGFDAAFARYIGIVPWEIRQAQLVAERDAAAALPPPGGPHPRIKYGMTIAPLSLFYDTPANRLVVEWIGIDSNRVLVAGHHPETGESKSWTCYGHGEKWRIVDRAGWPEEDT